MTDQRDKCARLAELHAGPEAFIIPNPWDAGSARLLEGLGFAALATTSAGFAFTLGHGDGEPTLAEKLGHSEAIARATSVPVNVDFEDGFAETPEEVAANVRRLAETGVAGCSIEDFNRTGKTLYDPGEATERVQAAAESVKALGMPFQLTARAENLLRGVNDLDDTVKRLQAYQQAGADVLYAPGIHSLDDLRQVTATLDKPFNVLVPFLPGASVKDLADAGARRISLGAALTWASLAPVLEASREMLEDGTFRWLRDIASGAEIGRLLKG